MEKDIHASHKGQGVTQTRVGAAPCKNGLARTLMGLLGVSAKACEGPAAAWGSSSSLNQCLTHNKCSWSLSCNLSPSMRTFLVPRVRASFLSDKCGNVLQYLQYISWAFSSKTTQGNLSIHEFWNILVRFSLSYLRSLFLSFRISWLVVRFPFFCFFD